MAIHTNQQDVYMQNISAILAMPKHKIYNIKYKNKKHIRHGILKQKHFNKWFSCIFYNACETRNEILFDRQITCNQIYNNHRFTAFIGLFTAHCLRRKKNTNKMENETNECKGHVFVLVVVLGFLLLVQR